MNILITGGTGLIGMAFIRQFKEHQFTALVRSIEKAKRQLPATVTLIKSLETLTNLDDFDGVINLAGEPIIDKRWNKKQKDRISESRWHTTQRLVTLFTRSNNPPEVFLSGSAIGVYGNRVDEMLTETSPVEKSDFASGLCLRWEALAKQVEPMSRVVLLRTGIVLTPTGGALAKMFLPFKLCLGGRIGDGQQFMSWIHLQDHINAMQYLLTESNVSGAVNLLSLIHISEPTRPY